ncbi:MAG: DUF4167 domain-containing protein [Maricaulaceae bacterium]|jgi:hypothetical protein
MKRQRGRGRKPNGGQSNRNFESNGPDIKIRGSASHIYDKYQQLARDATSSGDRIMAESYLQHAEHYFRVLRVQQQQQQQHARDRGEDQREGGQGGGQNSVQGGAQGGSRGDDGGASEQASERAAGNPLEVVDPEASDAASADAGDEGKPRRTRRPRRARSGEGDEASGDEATALDNAASQ